MRRWSLTLALCFTACDDVSEAPPNDASVAPDQAVAACAGGERRCVGELEQVCVNGAWADTASEACCPGGQCSGGGGDPCAVAAERRAYTGCEFWPVDLDNATEIRGLPAADGACPEGVALELPVCPRPGGVPGLCDFGGTCPEGAPCTPTMVCVLDAARAPFAVVVANPDPVNATQVTLADAAGATTTAQVAGGDLVVLEPAAQGLADQSVDFSSLGRRAYRLTSDLPVIAYQFNPLDDVGVYSNDGSLLLPTHAWDSVYRALDTPTVRRRPVVHDLNATLTVVAAQPVTVRVTPTHPVRAGEGVPALAAGETADFTLQPFDVLNLEAEAGGGLIGTRVETVGGGTIGVFSGHEGTLLGEPGTTTCCADHLEEQLFPVSSWGADFAVVRSQPRRQEADRVRIVGHAPETRVRFDGQLGVCPLLRPGEWCDVPLAQDTLIQADAPIQVGQLLVSVGDQADQEPPPGDPALAFVAPTSQWREDYALLVPAEYAANHLSVAAPMGGAVRLDGADVTGQLAPFGPNGAFLGGRIAVQPGTHRLTCPQRCAVMVHGYGPAVSYLFAGGLDLARITAP
ncbi:MAG: IgGFc-binding protein [Myxococcales bacterium]|nr:IgGFc-binding protein [Myxococcales bacterium]